MKEPSFLTTDNPRVKPVEHPFRHCCPMQIRFTDIDMLGHLNNNIYLQFMDLAKIEYFSKVMGRRVDMSRLNMVAVHVDIDFLSATYFGDTVEVWTQTVAIGVKSIHLQQRLVETRTHEVKAVANTVMSGYDMQSDKSMEILPAWRRALCRFELHEF